MCNLYVQCIFCNIYVISEHVSIKLDISYVQSIIFDAYVATFMIFLNMLLYHKLNSEHVLCCFILIRLVFLLGPNQLVWFIRLCSI